MRWEYFGVPRERNGFQGTFSSIATLSDTTNPSNTLTMRRKIAVQPRLQKFCAAVWFFLGSQG